jgi:hypothetical protein
MWWACGGYPSVTLVEDIAKLMALDGRPARVLYLGDHDPSGYHIPESFQERLAEEGVHAEVELSRVKFPPITFERVGLVPSDIARLALAPNVSDRDDPRSRQRAEGGEGRDWAAWWREVSGGLDEQGDRTSATLAVQREYAARR